MTVSKSLEARLVVHQDEFAPGATKRSGFDSLLTLWRFERLGQRQRRHLRKAERHFLVGLRQGHRFEDRRRQGRGGAWLDLLLDARRVDAHLFGGGHLPAAMISCVLEQVLQAEVVTRLRNERQPLISLDRFYILANALVLPPKALFLTSIAWDNQSSNINKTDLFIDTLLRRLKEEKSPSAWHNLNPRLFLH